jgi:hypothetical protein
MPDGVLTLKELLWGEELTANLHSSLVTAMRSDGALAAAAKLEFRPIMDEALAALGSALDISLGDILTSAWAKAAKLREAADPAQHSPQEVVLVPLLEHTIRSKQEPALDFTLNGKQVFSLKFAAEVTLELRGVILRVKAGRIREVAAGRANAAAKLSMGEATLAERSTADIALPLRISLGSGVPIPVPRKNIPPKHASKVAAI